jgi:enterochelin esterase-like enzyme
MRRLLALLVTTLLTAPLLAQALPQGPDTPEPELHADRSVTFRLVAPHADAVSLALEGRKLPLPMTRDANSPLPGVWTLTTAPLPPEVYSYHFLVDGRDQIDPLNPSIKTSYLSAGSSLLVPGSPAEPWELTDVPHGEVHHHLFTTKIVQGLPLNQDEFYVYTPPGYDPRANRRYPVLYLLHGWSDTAQGWSAIGDANLILDTLIAQGKARPMLVVMPLGYGQMSFVHQGFGIWHNAAAIDSNTRLFEQSLLSEIVPQVEAAYNVAPGRDNRAIAGLSMGGLEALTVGLSHTPQFAWIGGFSAAVHMLRPDSLPPLTAKQANLHLLWIACGTEDDLISANRRLTAALTAEGLPVTPIETPGLHTWLVWRDNLVHFAPLLFQPSPKPE